MGALGRTFLAIGAILALGCGGSGDDDGASGAAGSGGGGTSGGAGGSAGSATGGTGGAGGSAASGGSGGEPAPQTCGAQEARLSVDGTVISFPLAQAANINSANDTTDLWLFGSLIGQYGLMDLVGSGAIKGQAGQPLDGMPLTIDHGVIAPNVGDSLGKIYGVGPGSGSQLLRQGSQVDVELQGVAVLNGCGDFPVTGEIDLCHRDDGSACPDSAQGGMLDQYAWSDTVSSWTLTDGHLRASVGSQGGGMRALIGAGGTGPVTWAYITTSIYGHYAGKVVCAGEGSDAEQMSDATGSYTVLHLRNLAWLEGPGTGRASGCLR